MFAEIKGDILVTYPYDYDVLCKKNPFTNFPPNVHLFDLYEGTNDNLAGNTLVKVVELDPPLYDVATQKIQRANSPAYDGANWVIGWVITSLTQSEQIEVSTQKESEVRFQRQQKLVNSDWTQLPDAPVDKTAWATYRQALRDIPSQVGFPWDVQWPVEP